MTIQTDGFVSEPLQSEFIQIQARLVTVKLYHYQVFVWSDFWIVCVIV